MRLLTGTDTDRLPEEKRRGISIELGFAELPAHGISFIDVPGHKKLVHAMIAGVGGVDGALLVVAADDGVMPQTREHLWVCALLGIERIVVALSKVDLVDDETLELAEADVRATLESLGLSALDVVPTSALTGRGLPELERALVRLARGVDARADSTRLWLPIDRVFSVKGAGTVVTGTLTRGHVSIGDTLYVAGQGGVVEGSCRSLEVHGRVQERAEAPTRVAINLARVELARVHRGDVVSKDPGLPCTRRMDVSLRVLPDRERELSERSSVVVHAGTARRTGRVVRLGDGAAHVALDIPLPAEGGVGLILRGFRSTRDHGAVLAGGRIIDAGASAPPRRRDGATRERRAALIEAAAQGDFGAALGRLLELSAPRPIAAGEVERRFGLEPGTVARLLVGKKRRGPSDTIALPGGELFTTARAVERAMAELERELAAHHAAHPHEPAVSRETLRSRLGARTGRELADFVLQRALASERLRQVDAAGVALPAFADAHAPQARQAASSLLALLDEVGLEGVSETAIVARTGGKPEVVRSALQQLASAGSARRLGGLWFAEAHLERLRSSVREHLSAHASLSVPVFKELAGVSRKQAIPLLEQLDREGTTRRQGDLRVLGAAASKNE